MTENEPRFDPNGRFDGCHGDVVRQSPDVSLAFYMLSQAGTLSRDQLAASATAHLGGIGAMVELIRHCARAPGHDNGISFKEAIDLAIQAAAAARDKVDPAA